MKEVYVKENVILCFKPSEYVIDEIFSKHTRKKKIRVLPI